MAFDAVSTHENSNGGNTMTWTHTPVGTPTAVGVALANYDGGGSTVTGVTYGGVAMTKAVSQVFQTNSSVQIWGLANPPAGAQSIVISFAGGSTYCEAGAITVSGSSTTQCFDNTATNTSVSTGISTAVSSAAGEIVIDVATIPNGGTGSPTGAGQTQEWAQDSNLFLGSKATASGGSTTMSWSYGGISGGTQGQAVASFKHA